MTDHSLTNPCNYRDLVSDLVACALIEGNRHTQAAEFETKKAKQKVLDLFEAMESVGIRQERALARPAAEPSEPLEPTPEMIRQGIWAWERNERGSTADDVRAIYIAMRRMEGRSQKSGPCVCGEPNTQGVLHRTDGPCYVVTQR